MVPVRPGPEPDAALAGSSTSAATPPPSTTTRPARRVQMARMQTVEPGRVRPAPVEQRPDQYVSGTLAWNWPLPRAAPPARAAAAGGRRRADDGDLDDAARVPQGGGGQQRDVAAGRRRIRGVVHRRRETQVRRHDQRAEPGGARADLDRQPRARRHARRVHLLRLPRLRRRACSRRASCGRRAAIRCSTSRSRRSRPIPPSTSPVPDEVQRCTPPPVTVAVEKLRRRRLLHERRQPSQRRDRPAAITSSWSKRRRTKRARWPSSPRSRRRFPNKPIRYLINTHVHFDHSGGLRTYVDEGATIVTHEMNKPYYEQAWAAPRTLNPDRLAQSKKTADVRDVHRQARADRRQAADRDPPDRRQRPQRRVRDGRISRRRRS